jgi:hypothetical protein
VLTPLYPALVQAMSEVIPESVVCTSGTGLRLKDFDKFFSQNDMDSTVKIPVTNTFESLQQINLYIREILPTLKLTVSQGKLFIGRVGFLCKFLEWVLEERIRGSKATYNQLVKEFVQRETQIINGTLGGQIFLRNDLTKESAIALDQIKNKLRYFVLRTALYGEPEYLLATTPTTAWMFEQGLGQFFDDGSLKLSIYEPLVLMIIFNYFKGDEAWIDQQSSNQRRSRWKNEPALLKDYFADEMTMCVSESERGFIFELFLCMAILNTCTQDCRVFLEHFNSFESNGSLRLPASDKLISRAKDSVSLSEFLEKKPTAFYLPNQFAGPDLVFHIDLGEVCLPVFLQAKLQRFTNFESAMETTIPERFFCGRKPETAHKVFCVKEKNKVVNYLNDKKHLGVVVSHGNFKHVLSQKLCHGIDWI